MGFRFTTRERRASRLCKRQSNALDSESDRTVKLAYLHSSAHVSCLHPSAAASSSKRLACLPPMAHMLYGHVDQTLLEPYQHLVLSSCEEEVRCHHPLQVMLLAFAFRGENMPSQGCAFKNRCGRLVPVRSENGHSPPIIARMLVTSH